MIIQIPASCEGRLLRSYLQLTMGLSTTALSRLKKDERGILVNGQHVTVRYVLHGGDVLSLALDDKQTEATETVLPCEGPLDVLYEDDALIVLNKPAGTPTHPSHGHLTDTLANALAARYQKEGVPFVFRPLGRLDRNTSGVVVCGKTQAAAGFLGNCLADRTVVKRYLALLDGELPPDGLTHEIEVPILQPAAGVRMRTAVADGTPGAEYALTRYRVLASGNGHTLVLASPVTGRTHQIRVHFTSLGFPLTGDDVYGVPSPLIARQALHCVSLSLPMPFFSAQTAGRRGAVPSAADFDRLPAGTVLNRPSDDGWLHLWAEMPEDFRRAAEGAVPGCARGRDARGALPHTPLKDFLKEVLENPKNFHK